MFDKAPYTTITDINIAISNPRSYPIIVCYCYDMK